MIEWFAILALLCALAAIFAVPLFLVVWWKARGYRREGYSARTSWAMAESEV